MVESLSSNGRHHRLRPTEKSRHDTAQAHEAAYRADIDGLRGVAVISVVIFHVAQSFMRGGFIGVDIFFVISGYLISLQLFEGRYAGLIDFYERRIRRIAPAYAVMLIVMCGCVLIFSLPPETRRFGEALLSALASVSNIYFWATTNYFAVSAEELPLLHTWSLSVEEQFYLLFPLLIFSLNRSIGLAARRVEIVVALFLLSLLLSVFLVRAYPEAGFYLLPSRAWELLTGSLVALVACDPRLRSIRDAEGAFLIADVRVGLIDVLSVIAALMIVVPLYSYNPDVPFPGLRAIPPCLGAALIIYAGGRKETLVNWALSFQLIRFFGWISYSLYLWHWPIMVFYRTVPLFPLDSRVIERGAVLALSLLFATLSWWFIERPTRNRAVISNKALMRGVAAALLVLLAFVAIAIWSGGLPQRYSPDVVRMSRFLDYDQRHQFRDGKCFLARKDSMEMFDRNECLTSAADKENFIVVGDSHAAAISYGLRLANPDANVLQITGVGCPPLLAMQTDPSVACQRLIDLAFRELPGSRRISAIWLAARWNLGRAGAAPGWNRRWLEELRETVAALRKQNLKVAVLGPMPEYKTALPRLISFGIEAKDPTFPQRFISSESVKLDKLMEEAMAAEDVCYISMAKAICPSGACVTEQRGDPLEFDKDHLTDVGSVFVATAIKERLRANCGR